MVVERDGVEEDVFVERDGEEVGGLEEGELEVFSEGDVVVVTHCVELKCGRGGRLRRRGDGEDEVDCELVTGLQLDCILG